MDLFGTSTAPLIAKGWDSVGESRVTLRAVVSSAGAASQIVVCRAHLRERSFADEMKEAFFSANNRRRSESH
jgi:hypothetical protein